MKKEMFDCVSKNPELKSNDVYRKILVEYEAKYGKMEFWDDVVANFPFKRKSS